MCQEIIHILYSNPLRMMYLFVRVALTWFALFDCLTCLFLEKIMKQERKEERKNKTKEADNKL